MVLATGVAVANTTPRCACPVELHRVARLQEQIEGALRVGQRQACHPRHLGEPVEVLVQVGLVVRTPVDTQQLPAEQVVLLLVGRQLFQPHLPVLLHRLELLDDPVGPVVALLGAYRHLYFMDDLLDESLVNRGDILMRSKLECVMTTASQSPVAMRDTSSRRRSPSRSSLSPSAPRRRDRVGRTRPCTGPACGWGPHGRLVARPSRRSSMLAMTHDRRLARTDHMEQPGVAGLHDAPHGVPLVRMQFEAAGESRQLQVRAVERRAAWR
jgi:hypothetical protein